MTVGKLVVISGPSAGAGKDTVINGFLKRQPDWYRPFSITTRPPRAKEDHDERMKHVDIKTFKEWQKAGKFLETDFHTGAWYGTPREPIEERLKKGINVIKLIDVNGAQKLKKVMPEAILVFIKAENWEALEARIRARGTEDEAMIRHRLELAKHELGFEGKYDHVVINPTGEPEKAVASLEQLITD